MGFEPVLDNNQDIKVRVEHTDDVQKILKTIKETGASLRSLDVRKPNLEEVFLKLTGEALREGPPGGKGVDQPASRRRKSRRERHELLPREDRHVLHHCLPDTPDTRVRHHFQDQDNVRFNLYVQDLDQTNSSVHLVETLTLTGKFQITHVDPGHQRQAVRQGKQAEPGPHHSQRL